MAARAVLDERASRVFLLKAVVGKYLGWSAHAISMPNYPFIKKLEWISVCLCRTHARCMCIRVFLGEWIFLAWILLRILHEHFNLSNRYK